MIFKTRKLNRVSKPSRSLKASVLGLAACMALTSAAMPSFAHADAQGKTPTPEQQARRALRKKKIKEALTQLGRTTGLVSTQVAVETARPFITASAFVRAFFEKETTNADSGALLTILIRKEYHDRLAEISVQQPDFKSYLVAMTEEVSTILEEYGDYTLKSILRDVRPSLDMDLELAQIKLTPAEAASMNADLIRKNPDFRLFEAAVGGIDESVLADVLRTGKYDMIDTPDVDFSNYKAALPNPLEAGSTVFSQLILTPMILGSISSLLGNIYTLPIELGYVGAGISIWQCLIDKNEARVKKAMTEGRTAYQSDEQYANDLDLAQFCMKVTNDSIFKLTLSRSKGFVAGKNAKKWFNKKFPHDVAAPPAAVNPMSEID